jgi:hypothetical protein
MQHVRKMKIIVVFVDSYAFNRSQRKIMFLDRFIGFIKISSQNNETQVRQDWSRQHFSLLRKMPSIYCSEIHYFIDSFFGKSSLSEVRTVIYKFVNTFFSSYGHFLYCQILYGYFSYGQFHMLTYKNRSNKKIPFKDRSY